MVFDWVVLSVVPWVGMMDVIQAVSKVDLKDA